MLDIYNNIDSKTDLVQSFQIVSFTLSNEEFALYISDILEIIKIQSFTIVPLTKDYVKGIINLRGAIIPVVDLRRKISFYETELTNLSRIIIVHNNNRKVGFIVDKVNEVISITQDNLSKFYSDSNEGRFIESLCTIDDRIITLFKIEAIMDNL
ncbi:MAG: chemotaxis protein CheW [Candidatus Sericytochromatia bacterium]